MIMQAMSHPYQLYKLVVKIGPKKQPKATEISKFPEHKLFILIKKDTLSLLEKGLI